MSIVWRVFAIWGFLSVSFPAGSFANQAEDSQWDQGIALLEQGHFEPAARAFETWIQSRGELGWRVSEAHHNLALAYGGQKQWGLAVYHQVVGARLSPNPLTAWRLRQDLTQIQNRLMIQNPVSRSWLFFLSLAVSPGLWLVFAVTAFWCFAFMPWAPRAKKFLGRAGLVSAVAALVASGVDFLPEYAVVVPHPGGALLKAKPSLGTQDALAELAEGTLVQVRGHQDFSVAIIAPFAGWLPEDAVRRFRPLGAGEPVPAVELPQGHSSEVQPALPRSE